MIFIGPFLLTRRENRIWPSHWLNLLTRRRLVHHLRWSSTEELGSDSDEEGNDPAVAVAELTNHDLRTLEGTRWLNDMIVISHGFQLLTRVGVRRCRGHSPPTTTTIAASEGPGRRVIEKVLSMPAPAPPA